MTESWDKQKPKRRRRLVAAMFTDIVGYSALSQKNEDLAVDLLNEYYELFRKIFPSYGGIENKTMGDGFFIEFGSAVEAVRCGVELQTALYERNVRESLTRKLNVRIGIHLADVIDSDEDTYGDGINIAARVEQVADSGGIFLTQVVVDQIRHIFKIPLIKMGARKLKNIRDAHVMYRVQLPWERSTASVLTKFFSRPAVTTENGFQQKLSNMRLAFQGFFYVAVPAILVLGFFSHQQKNGYEFAVGTKERVDLSQGWRYSLQSPALAKSDDWKKFDPYDPQIMDALIGKYWLRKEFDLAMPTGLLQPAIALGIIAHKHRVLLNGVFIGGSDRYAIEYYPFDKKHLQSKNTLILEAYSEPSILPGLYIVHWMGSFLGEFSDVYRQVSWDRFEYHSLRLVYLAVSLILIALCFIHYISHLDRKEYLYFSLFLFSGSLMLFYYYGYTIEWFSYQHHRLIKAVGLGLASFSLLGAYAVVRKKPAVELLVHFSSMVSVGFFVGFFLPTDKPSQFVTRYENAMDFIFLATVAWLFWVLYDFAGNIMLSPRELKKNISTLMYQALVITFGCLVLALITSSLNLVDTPLEKLPLFVNALNRVGIAYPFFFSLALLAVGIVDYSWKSRSVIYEKAREDLIVELTRSIETSPDINTCIRFMQQRVCEFLDAERSTIYLMDAEESCLQADFVYGSFMAKEQILKVIRPSGGLIGHVYKSRTPILIVDLSKDIRFLNEAKGLSSVNTYKTESCMLFPLISNASLIGIITIADKQDGSSFNQMDFALMNLVAKDLAVLLANRKLRAKLDKFLAA